MHWKAGPGKKVATLGLGALGHMAVKIARALGTEVTVLSHCDKKREDALKMGDYFNLLKRDAILVVVGLPEKPLSIHPFPLVLMRRSYSGSVIGSIKETQEMLDFCAKHNITPEIELITPAQVNEAYERVIKSDVRYRIVMDMGKI